MGGRMKVWTEGMLSVCASTDSSQAGATYLAQQLMLAGAPRQRMNAAGAPAADGGGRNGVLEATDDCAGTVAVQKWPWRGEDDNDGAAIKPVLLMAR